LIKRINVHPHNISSTRSGIDHPSFGINSLADFMSLARCY
jgi:hypothetical protein